MPPVVVLAEAMKQGLGASKIGTLNLGPDVVSLVGAALAKAALGGLLAHAAESMAVYASSVNSYKRYWDAGQFAPSRVDWGLDDRSRSVRVSAAYEF